MAKKILFFLVLILGSSWLTLGFSAPADKQVIDEEFKQIKAEYEKAHEALKKGKYSEAVAGYNKILAIFNQGAKKETPQQKSLNALIRKLALREKALMGIATAYQATGNLQAEADIYERLLKLFATYPDKGKDRPELAKVILWKTQALAGLGKTDELKDIYEQVVKDYFEVIKPSKIIGMREAAERNLEDIRQRGEGIDKQIKEAYLNNDHRRFFYLLNLKKSIPARIEKMEDSLKVIAELEREQPQVIRQPPQIDTYVFNRRYEPKSQLFPMMIIRAYVKFLRQHNPDKASEMIKSLKLSFDKKNRGRNPQGMTISDEVYKIVEEL